MCRQVQCLVGSHGGDLHGSRCFSSTRVATAWMTPLTIALNRSCDDVSSAYQRGLESSFLARWLQNLMKINLLSDRGVLSTVIGAIFSLMACSSHAEIDSQKSFIDIYGKQLVRERAKGPILISIPVAYVFGLGGERSPLYCSPSVRASNGSNAVIEELVVGVNYQTAAGVSVGSSVSRFTNIKVKRIESHFFNQLETAKCSGLRGEINVVRCVYSSGEDCSSDIQAVGYGAIPLQLKHGHSGGGQ